MRIRVIPVRSQCHFKIPVVSAGGIIVAERYCILPREHNGPHQDGHGAVIVNEEALRRELGG